MCRCVGLVMGEMTVCGSSPPPIVRTQPEKAFCEMQGEKGLTELACCSCPAAEIIAVPPSELCISKKHGFPVQEMGRLWNSIT